ncbi:hypothetical protein QBC47DRAFT_353365 [Echria macrotheca]|uniref:HD/PDEase domain-containing protein n=1 Tax=Echria macrotheca TaxID=438768 RepID=A0AAJ0F6R5_9PEZI|nr:hypothetical protein QBC47DRAFT_353365 [Echria macrotheca]
MSPTPEPGYFQTLEYHADNTVTIRDDLYGTHTIAESALVALLHSQPLTRLSGVHQHGITGLLGLTPKVTRLEHSVGAFLLVRMAGASVAEQAAALLHDVSHTVLSHVIDWALSRPGVGEEESFHEVHKARYVRGMTSLVEILGRHGLGEEVLHEEKFPLVEMVAPHLCADRLDYGLRDAVGFGKLSREDARRVVEDLVALPGPEAPGRMLVLRDVELALGLARGYLAVDREVWSNPRHIDMYRRAGEVIGSAVRGGAIPLERLWTSSDREFWEELRRVTDDAGREVMRQLEEEGLQKAEESLGLPKRTKVRTIDPDVYATPPGETEAVCRPLSEWLPAWAAERDEYIAARKRIIGL